MSRRRAPASDARLPVSDAAKRASVSRLRRLPGIRCASAGRWPQQARAGRRRAGLVVALVAALVVAAAACSSSPSPDAAAPGATSDTAPATSSAVPSGDANGPIGDTVLPDLGDRDLDVEHYDLVLDYDPDTGALDGTATLTAGVRRPVDEVVLDLLDLDVDEVTVDDAEVAAEVDDGKLRVPLGRTLEPGETADVRIDYGGVPDPTLTRALGVEVGWQVRDGSSFVLSEPEGARTWFPVNDHPTDKATYDITVTVPADVVAVANGELVEQSEDDAAGTATFGWRMEEPMAPYLATVVTGGYTAQPAVTGSGVEQTVWTTERDTADGDLLLEAQGEALELLTGWLGPFPFDSYASVVLPPDREVSFFDGVAIETQTMTLYGAGAISPETVVHEAAHQWFGDAVSITDWSRDIWWVEGFARYAEWLWLEETEGRATYDRAVEAAWESLADARDPQPAGELPLDELFSSWSYQRGALTFAALREQLGDEDFFAFLAAFVERYDGSNASTADLIATATDISGDELGPLFEAWLFTDAMPPPPA